MLCKKYPKLASRDMNCKINAKATPLITVVEPWDFETFICINHFHSYYGKFSNSFDYNVADEMLVSLFSHLRYIKFSCLLAHFFCGAAEDSHSITHTKKKVFSQKHFLVQVSLNSLFSFLPLNNIFFLCL